MDYEKENVSHINTHREALRELEPQANQSDRCKRTLLSLSQNNEANSVMSYCIRCTTSAVGLR
jgi:hypothetical protein